MRSSQKRSQPFVYGLKSRLFSYIKMVPISPPVVLYVETRETMQNAMKNTSSFLHVAEVGTNFETNPRVVPTPPSNGQIPSH